MELRAAEQNEDERLRDSVLTGRAAIFADWLTIALMLGVVLAVWFASGAEDVTLGLCVPLLALAAGVLGTLCGGSHVTGFIRNWRYVAIYSLTIAAMIAADMGVRALLGGDIPMVLANWAVLIGSASTVNALVSKIPGLNLRRWFSETDVSGFHPVAMVIALVLQVAQLWISVLGAAWTVVLVQLLVRRVLILPITHLIARANYGNAAPDLLRSNATLEYVSHRVVADAEGQVQEPNRVDQCVVGNVLLKLPIFGGEPMNAGRKSLVRVFDKIVFLEQMLAFSSPTLVVGRTLALGHIAFLQTVVSFDGDPSELNPELRNRLACKRRMNDFVNGRRESLVGAGVPVATGTADRVAG
jgi:hypothetical protein